MGKSGLIGKLEGPEVVTDPAKFPKTLHEAPQLAALVKAGKLPPVAERVGRDPLLIKPLHEIDKVGLAKKDAQGYCLRADGKGRLRIEIMTLGGQFVQFTQIAFLRSDQHRTASHTEESRWIGGS